MNTHDDAAAAFAQHGDAAAGIPIEWVDTHVGESLADALRDGWRYVEPWRRWLHWDGRRWGPADAGEALEAARQWIITIGEALLTLPGERDLRRLASYKNVAKLTSALTVASWVLRVDPGALDQHPYLLNAGNGIIDLRTGDLQPHDSTLMLTKIAGADYQRGARHHDIDQVHACLERDVQASVQRYLGAAASGVPTDELAVFDGSGANGKTTLLRAVQAALGDYAGTIQPELVMQSGGGDNSAVWMAELRGLRFAYLEETKEDGRLRLERVKALTGGGRLTAARKYEHPFSFDPSHTLAIATNHRPIVNSAEHAAWRRLRLVPFPHRFDAHRPDALPIDEGLRRRVDGAAQRRAMLAWVVEGAVLALRTGGGEVPVVDWCDTVLRATQEWRDGEDVIGRFIASRVRLVHDQRAVVRGPELFREYRHWCDSDEGGRPPGHAKNFYSRWEAHDAVTDAGVTRYMLDGSPAYRGCELKPWFRADCSEGGTSGQQPNLSRE